MTTAQKGKLYIKAFHPEHLNLIVLKPIEARLLKSDNLVTAIECKNGAVHTVMADGKIVFIVGYVLRDEAVAHVYVIPSVYVYEYALQTIRHIRKMMAQVIEVCPFLHRMESFAYDAPDIDKWMRAFGFECEGVHPKWSADGDTFKSWGKVVR